jgi:hypothetical protein
VAHDADHLPVFGYNFIPAETLFGDTIITPYAAKGYTFWSKSDVMEGLMGESTAKQAANRIQFQQSIGARYVWGTDIQAGGVLPAATGDEEVLNTLTPHVVLTTANLGVSDIRTKVDAFFANANTAARARAEGHIPAAHEHETDEQTDTRLAAESKAKAVAVIDVEAVNAGGVHELRLGRFGNTNGYPSILPEIRRLIITTASEEPLRIADHFLVGCRGLISLDLSLLSNVTTIGRYFLAYCRGLTSLDLRGLENITTIGDLFLVGCTGLTSLDLRPLSNVTTIGHYFLAYCTGLTSLDLSPLSNVTTIGHYFLVGCTGLTSLDLSPLSNVTTIGHYFLVGCTGLTSLDLRPLSNVTTIGNAFLRYCHGLTSLDLSPLSNVTTIGHDFLAYCHGLRTIKGFSYWKNITTIGTSFLGNTGAVSITPNLDGAPVPDLNRLRMGGESAVQEIKSAYKRFHEMAALNPSPGGAGAGAGAGAGSSGR